MAPIKFEIKKDIWVGVGDFVYAVEYDREVVRGCITGFSFNDDSVDGVELIIHGMMNARTKTFNLEDVFADQGDAQSAFVGNLIDDYISHRAELRQKKERIQHTIDSWSVPVRFEP